MLLIKPFWKMLMLLKMMAVLLMRRKRLLTKTKNQFKENNSYGAWAKS